MSNTHANEKWPAVALVGCMIAEMRKDFDISPTFCGRWAAWAHHIALSIELTEQRSAKGFAYMTDNGDVFDVRPIQRAVIRISTPAARRMVDKHTQPDGSFCGMSKRATSGDSSVGRDRSCWHECSLLLISTAVFHRTENEIAWSTVPASV